MFARNKGYTLVELTVTIFVLSILVGVIQDRTSAARFDAKLDASVRKAIAIVTILENIRLSAISSKFDPITRTVSVSYPLISAGSHLDVAQSYIDRPIHISSVNDFDKPFEIEIAAKFSSVVVVVPGRISYNRAPSSFDGTNTRITISSELSRGNSIMGIGNAYLNSKLFNNSSQL